MNESIVVVKLVSGEQLMGTLINEDKTGILIELPVSIKTINVQTDKGILEKTITGPYCNVTDETIFEFDWHHVLFVKNLHPALVPLYHEIISDDKPGRYIEDEEDHDSEMIVNNEKKVLH